MPRANLYVRNLRLGRIFHGTTCQRINLSNAGSQLLRIQYFLRGEKYKFEHSAFETHGSQKYIASSDNTTPWSSKYVK